MEMNLTLVDSNCQKITSTFASAATRLAMLSERSNADHSDGDDGTAQCHTTQETAQSHENFNETRCPSKNLTGPG
eukprot:m.1103 g.1103  ORF g.1103 m.1103 type:complete len:75 (+) comp746_c0_seq1:108-332(+)